MNVGRSYQRILFSILAFPMILSYALVLPRWSLFSKRIIPQLFHIASHQHHSIFTTRYYYKYYNINFQQLKMISSSTNANDRDSLIPMKQVLFVEIGTGCDQHGQNATKAAVRACNNAQKR